MLHRSTAAAFSCGKGGRSGITVGWSSTCTARPPLGGRSGIQQFYGHITGITEGNHELDGLPQAKYWQVVSGGTCRFEYISSDALHSALAISIYFHCLNAHSPDFFDIVAAVLVPREQYITDQKSRYIHAPALEICLCGGCVVVVLSTCSPHRPVVYIPENAYDK